ncbi:fimbrial protein-like protein [Pseudomonas putida S11]|nr:fimbrial protein-like protein [Pseudomonas putida S11]
MRAQSSSAPGTTSTYLPPVYPTPLRYFLAACHPIDGKNVDGYVMQTNVPGVGVYLELFDPFDGSAPNTFRPDHGRPTIPYTGTMAGAGPFYLRLFRLYGQAWLIKTGPIASGPQRIDGELFHGSIHHLGKVLEYRLSATVNQAQCSLKADAVSADPVHLGDYKADDFKGVGTTTKPVPFHINLVDCKDASAPLPGTANVYIELDGIDGSKPTVPAQGRFSLTSASDADGVEIQLLRGDTSNPMPPASGSAHEARGNRHHPPGLFRPLLPELADSEARLGRGSTELYRKLQMTGKKKTAGVNTLRSGWRRKTNDKNEERDLRPFLRSSILERETRLELATPTLARSCSTN